MSVEARAHLDCAIASGARELEVRAYLLAHPELDEDEKKRLRALCRFLNDENERAMELWFEARVASGFAAEMPAGRATELRRDVDDVDLDLWGQPESLL